MIFLVQLSRKFCHIGSKAARHTAWADEPHVVNQYGFKEIIIVIIDKQRNEIIDKKSERFYKLKNWYFVKKTGKKFFEWKITLLQLCVCEQFFLESKASLLINICMKIS